MFEILLECRNCNKRFWREEKKTGDPGSLAFAKFFHDCEEEVMGVCELIAMREREKDV